VPSKSMKNSDGTVVALLNNPFIVIGLMAILDLLLHEYLLRSTTFKIDSDTLIENHMACARDLIFIIAFVLIFRFRKQVWNMISIRPMWPLYLFIIIDGLCKLAIIRHYQIPLDPITIFHALTGLLMSLIPMTLLYLIALYFPVQFRSSVFKAFFFSCVAITILDLTYFDFTGTHVKSVVFRNINFDSIKGAISGLKFWYYILVVSGALLLNSIVSFSFKKFISANLLRRDIIRLLLCLGVLLPVSFAVNVKLLDIDRGLAENFSNLYVRFYKTRQEHRNYLTVSPIFNLVHEAYAGHVEEKEMALQPQIAYQQRERRFLEELGLLSPRNDKPTIIENYPYKSIVLIIFESLHSDYIHHNNPEIPAEATPFFDQLLNSYPHLDNYYTSAIPTTQGLTAIFLSQMLCSYEFSARYHRNTLFNLLSHKGLEGYFVSGVSGDLDDEARNYPRRFRMDHYMAKAELDKRYSGASGWGHHDNTIFREGLHLLKERNGKPTFLVLKLIDLHQPGEYSGFPREELPLEIRRRDNRVLDSIYWDDRCLQTFFQQVEEAGLFKNDTLFVITADHSPFEGSQEFVRPENRKKLGEIPLIFMSADISPFKKLEQDRFSCQLDLAPTLLYLMGIESPPYFLGNNLFAEGRGYAIGLRDNTVYYERKGISLAIPRKGEEISNTAIDKWLHNMFSEDFIAHGGRTRQTTSADSQLR
jgi:lipoteichoic acid synthase